MTVNPLLPVSVTISVSDAEVCAGTMVTFLASGINAGSVPVYQWYVNGNPVSGNSGPVFSYIPLNGDIVSCRLTSSEVCATGNPALSNLIPMTVNPILPVSVTIEASSTVVCAGTSVTATATPVNGGLVPLFDWYINGTLMQSSPSDGFIFVPNHGDALSCVVHSDEECVSGNPATSNAIIFTVNPILPVSVAISPSATEMCAGSSVTVTATPVNGGSSPQYQWYLNGLLIQTATGPVYTFIPASGDLIHCVLISNAICPSGNPATSNTVQFTVHPILPVSVTIASSAVSVCAGTGVVVTASPVNGGTSPQYSWYLNGLVISGASGSSYSFVPSNGNIVHCVLTSSEACTSGNPATSNPVLLAVNPLLPVSVSITASANPVYSGTSVTFTATPVNGGPAPVYQWKVNGSNAGSNSATFTYTPANGDQVTCRLTSNATCATNNPAMSNTIIMQVQTVPTNLNLQNLTISDIRCYDATQTITVAGSGTTFTIQSGARVTMIAGQKIRYLAGTTVKKGGYMRGYITTNGQYCASLPPALMAVTTGNEELPGIQDRQEIMFYPNPTTGTVTMEFSGEIPDGIVTINLFSMQGEKVMEKSIEGNRKHVLNIGDKPAGMYLIQVITGTKAYTGRIIKR